MSFDEIAILVAEDEQELRELLVEEFTSRGAVTSGASNGIKAFELLKIQKFDVVLSDVRMPGGDGVELIKKINGFINPKPKVFLYTGYSDLTEEGAKELGVIRMFHKPSRIKDMIQAIVDCLK